MEGASHCLALDCGASSIRLIDVALGGERLVSGELARFDNATRTAAGKQAWDTDGIFRQIEGALRAAGTRGVRYGSIGVDSWGVDYVLLDENGALLAPAVAYRDARTGGQIEHYTARHLPAHALFAATGIQCLQFNTLFQLYAQSRSEPELLRRTKRLLFTADYAHFRLCGVAKNERTLASTSQMLTTGGDWFRPALESVGLSPAALAPPIPAGTVLGPLRPELARETGLGEVQVVAPAAHDTQSAILCTPASGDESWAYLSLGTWSIIGTESVVPALSAEAEKAGIGNESGYGGKFCVQMTVAGLWLVQEIRRLLGTGDISRLAAEAEAAAAFRSLVNPADPRFFNPRDMIAQIRAACGEAGEPLPQTPGELVRCAYDSLALLYREALAKLAAVTGRRFTRIHVLGGGSKAALLNRLIAGAAGLPVLAGPAEATALGNAMAQMIALGMVADAEQGRLLVGRSYPPVPFEPARLPQRDDAIARFRRLSREPATP